MSNRINVILQQKVPSAKLSDFFYILLSYIVTSDKIIADILYHQRGDVPRKYNYH